MTPASKALSKNGIPHAEFKHAGPIRSIEQAAAERGQRTDQIVRSILFRLKDGEYLLVLIAGPAQIPWPNLRKYIGQSRLSLVKAEEVLSVTGFVVGSVSPFGLPTPIRTLLDKSVLKQDEISIGSGVRGTSIIIKVDELARALREAEIVDLFAEQ